VATPERTWTRFPLLRQTIETQDRFYEAIRLGRTLGLRALDALDLTYAKTMRDSVPDLKTFTTLDRETLSRRKEIENEPDITVASPLDGH
jgi:hypothetical protein